MPRNDRPHCTGSPRIVIEGSFPPARAAVRSRSSASLSRFLATHTVHPNGQPLSSRMIRVLDCVSMLSRTRQGGEIRLGEDPDASALLTEKRRGGGRPPLRSRFFSGLWASGANFVECVRN